VEAAAPLSGKSAPIQNNCDHKENNEAIHHIPPSQGEPLRAPEKAQNTKLVNKK
jgi:hypothetical protein